MGCISLSVGAIVLLFIAVAIDPASKTTSSNKTNDAAAADSRRSNSAATESTQTTKATTEADKPASKYADGGKQFAWIDTSEDAIRNQLKDPDSAIFRNVHFYSGGGIPVACGEVNAKNGFGGYTGFERFVAAGDTLAVTESQVQGGLGPVWKKYCVRAPTDAR